MLAWLQESVIWILYLNKYDRTECLTDVRKDHGDVRAEDASLLASHKYLEENRKLTYMESNVEIVDNTATVELSELCHS